MSAANSTTDHETIKQWAESRGGHPATVRETEADSEPGVLRIDFDPRDESLERIDWKSFFDKFDEKQLEFLYQERTEDGKISRFCKFVERGSAG